MRLHESLWNENCDLACACLDHSFVQGLARGDLNTDAFKRYVAQDVFFLRAFFSAYAVAAAKCATSGRLDVAHPIHSLMKGVLDELRLHASFAQSLGIDLDDVEPHPATRAYTDFLLHMSWSRDPAEILAAMTPCMRLYAYLGQELRGRDKPENPYREWIRTYASADFAALAQELEALLDELGELTPALRDAYRYAMRCELSFFSAPLESAV
jgi:thiaminase/transcriptional activator TenA